MAVGFGVDWSGDIAGTGTASVPEVDTVRLLGGAGAQSLYVALKAPTLSATYTLTMPVDDGTANQFLQTDGSGALAWASASTGDLATQYALLAGRTGGQVLIGSVANGQNLTLRSTSAATKGSIKLADEGGNVQLGGGTAACELQFYEPSGSGSNYTAFKAQAQAADLTYTLPAADGAGRLISNGSGALSWDTEALVRLTADVTTQAAQETGTSNVLFVTPGRQQFHPSAAKGWTMATFGGVSTVGYNITSITDTGTGQVTVVWGTDFSTADYCVLATARITSSVAADTMTCSVNNTGITAGTVLIDVRRVSDGALSDANQLMVAGFGDQ